MQYGLLGERLSHSWSKPIHAMLADYSYELYPVTPDQLRDIMTRRAFRGLNVTIPYKRDVMPYCDRLTDDAREVGSVNTLVMEADGTLTGHNTDLYGFLSMAERGCIGLSGEKIVILGTGGTSLTAQAACRRAGAREIVVVSRKEPVDYDALKRRHTDAGVIINTTPVGMYPENGVSAVDLSCFPDVRGVIDVIYNPLRTKLLQDARDRGLNCVDGLWMLVAQAKKAAEYFTARAIDDGEIERVHRAMRAEMSNCVLIGMPGSGKSTTGRLLASEMGRTFVDLDDEIEKLAGVSIPDLFASKGEDAFRDLEYEAAARFGKERSLVIAAGGGAVKRADTMRALSQNGVVLWLKRDVAKLPTHGRPLSRDRETVLRIYAERMPLYERYSDASLDNDGTVEAAAVRLKERFYEAVDH